MRIQEEISRSVMKLPAQYWNDKTRVHAQSPELLMRIKKERCWVPNKLKNPNIIHQSLVFTVRISEASAN